MLTRLVKLTFKEEAIEVFEKQFEEVKDTIKRFEGCLDLRLLHDRNDQRIFFTQSVWENEQALQNYRDSSFFKELWPKTKSNFAERAEAWSVNIHTTV